MSLSYQRVERESINRSTQTIFVEIERLKCSLYQLTKTDRLALFNCYEQLSALLDQSEKVESIFSNRYFI